MPSLLAAVRGGSRAGPAWPLLALALALALLLPALSLSAVGQSARFYITFHGGKSGLNNAYSYGLDGTLLSKGVLQGDSASELRGLLLRPDWTLLLANAHKTDSRLSHFSRCDANGLRSYLGDFADGGHLSHPYGLAGTPNSSLSRSAPADADADGAAAHRQRIVLSDTLLEPPRSASASASASLVFASNQDSSAVVSFDSATGAFVRVVADFGTDEIRGLAVDARRNVLYVANKDQAAAVAIEIGTNSISSNLTFADIKKPIGLWIDDAADVLYVGSNGKHSAVYSYSLATRQLLHVFSDPSLSHPAGLLTLGDSLYVLSQDTQSLLRFSTVTGQLTATLISDMPDAPEQIFLSPC